MDFNVMNSSAGVDYTVTSKVQANTTSAENVTTKNAATKNAETVIDKYSASDPVKKVSVKKEDGTSNAGSEERNEGKETIVDEKFVSKALEEANRNLKGFRRSFEYNVDELTERIIIKVIDSETKEVIKEIPPERQNDAVKKMWELAGLIVDKKI